MIVHRMTFYIKPGHIEEACALVLAEIKRVNWHRPIRLYTSKTGRFNTLATENDFANLAEYEQYWNDWFRLWNPYSPFADFRLQADIEFECCKQ